MNASVELASVRGIRLLPLQEFIQGPRVTARRDDEIVVAIHFPDMDEAARSEFVKLGARRYLVISIVMVSVVLIPDAQGRLKEARVAVGACSAVARRLHQLEAVLQGQPLNTNLPSLVEPSLFSELAPLDDVRGSAEYRLQVVQQLIRQLLTSCLQCLTSPPSGNDGREVTGESS